MRKKLKYKFIFLLVTVLLTTLFLSTSCEVIEHIAGLIGKIEGINTVDKAYEEVLKEIEREELDEEDRREADEHYEKMKEIEQALEETELLEGFEEEERLIPNEPITYSGEFDGISIVMTVDFKTTAVSGSMNASGDYYLSAGIEGTINIETFEVNANFSGIMGAKEVGKEEPWSGIINGEISEDLSIFNGDIKDDEDYGTKFTATR